MRRSRTILPALALAFSIPVLPAIAADAGALVYFASRASGPGQGIVAARLDLRSGRLSSLGRAVEIDRPTWIIAKPGADLLYALDEMGNVGAGESGIATLRADRATGKLAVVSKVRSGGVGATYLTLDPEARTVFAAHFGSGQVSALPVLPDGALGPAVSIQANYGTGPLPRQASPHAHAVAVAPGGRFVLSPDLGADRLFVYGFDSATRKLAPGKPPFEAMPPGAGPRQLAIDPRGRFVFAITEMRPEVRVYRWDGLLGRLQLAQTLTLATQEPGKSAKTGSAITVTRDGRHLYLSVRGDDVIVGYQIDQEAGTLTEMQRISAQGEIPWGFALDPSERWLLVANYGSNSVSVLKRDPRSGRLSATKQSLPVALPISVTFLGG